MAKIGEENPITAMVALTSTLEPTAVQTLIEKMEAIRDSIKDSIKAEEEAEAKNARVLCNTKLGHRHYLSSYFQCHRKFDQRKVQ